MAGNGSRAVFLSGLKLTRIRSHGIIITLEWEMKLPSMNWTRMSCTSPPYMGIAKATAKSS